MNIEVRNVKYSASLSEETMAYAADIYVDGVKVGDAKNRGHGGCTIINPILLRDQIQIHAKAQPDYDPTYKFEVAETYIDGLVSSELDLRDMKKAMKKNVVFTKPDGRVYMSKATKGEDVGNLAVQIRQSPRIGAVKVLNLLPEAEAFKLWKGQTQ